MSKNVRFGLAELEMARGRLAKTVDNLSVVVSPQ